MKARWKMGDGGIFSIIIVSLPSTILHLTLSLFPLLALSSSFGHPQKESCSDIATLKFFHFIFSIRFFAIAQNDSNYILQLHA